MANIAEMTPIAVATPVSGPMVQQMHGAQYAPAAHAIQGENAFLEHSTGIFIEQQFNLVEALSGCEAKNRYAVHQLVNGLPGAQTMFIREESECCQRICCGPSRSLTLFVHEGVDKQGRIIAQIKKQFGCSACCCLRPHFDVFDSHAEQLGSIEDPCALCVLNQRVNNPQGHTDYVIAGGCCQLGL
jgi:hypothetical protein